MEENRRNITTKYFLIQFRENSDPDCNASLSTEANRIHEIKLPVRVETARFIFGLTSLADNLPIIGEEEKTLQW